MARCVELLVCAREDNGRKGEIIVQAEKDSASFEHPWGKKECPPLFAVIKINSTETDFAEQYDTGETMVVGKDEEDKDVTVPIMAKRYKISDALVDAAVSEGGVKTILVGDVTDVKP